MATIYEVSKLAGVSLATVSRVMNNNARVSDKTREKVESAMQALGYRPNANAQSLASNRSNSVGLMVSELHGPFFGEIMSGVERELRGAGKHAFITSGHSNEAEEKTGIEFLISRNCDALVLHVEAVSDEYLIELSKGKTPFVLINRYVPELKQHCISLDNEAGGYLATRYVLDQGHRDIAYIAGPEWKKDANDRLAGHLRALKEANIAIDQGLIYRGNFQQSGGREGLMALRAAQRKFTTVICGNDEMASGVISAAGELNIPMPQALSVVGFDNIIYSSYLVPKLTTVDYPVWHMGQMAARMVLQQTYDVKGLDIHSVFMPKLIERQSVDRLKS